eukprot:6212959-Pleurochrysis_carterae.AAC.1
MLTNEKVVVIGRVVCPRLSTEGKEEGLSQHGPGLPRACASGSDALSIGASRCVRLAACAPLRRSSGRRRAGAVRAMVPFKYIGYSETF